MPWKNRLSDLKIDEDKDWNSKAVASMKTLSLNSMIKLKGLTADPSVGEGVIWFRKDVGDGGEYRVRGPRGLLGSLVGTLPSPDNAPNGLGIDSNDSIWVAEGTPAKIYQIYGTGGDGIPGAKTGTSFTSPSGSPEGVTVDANDSIWFVDAYLGGGAGTVLKANQAGSIITSFNHPSGWLRGIGIDSSGSLWIGNDDEELNIYLMKTTQSGGVISSFSTSNCYGVDVDSNDCIWYSEPDGIIYKLNQSYSVQSSFQAPSLGMYGIGFDSNDCLWVANYEHAELFKFTSGKIITKPILMG